MRVVHKHSRRRMIMSFVAVSAVQVLLVLGLLQIVLPPSITGTVYISGAPSTCYVQYFDEGCCPSPGTCHGWGLQGWTVGSAASRLTHATRAAARRSELQLRCELHSGCVTVSTGPVPLSGPGFHVPVPTATSVPAHQRGRQHRVLLC